jgi:hypothetical protein
MGTGVNNEACFGNSESEALRSKILAKCDLDSSMLERDWWQDGGTSIQFNYSGTAGSTQGASIDVNTSEVTFCR